MRNIQKAVLLGGLVGLLAGCSVEGGDSTASREHVIVNGQPACDPALEAVGAVVFRFAEYDIEEFYCTATLIGPKVALTARHCVTGESGWHYDEYPGFENYVVFGKTYDAPKQEARIAGFLAAPAGPGGLLNDGGRDMAVLYLEDSPKKIKPVKLGLFQESMLGKQFRIAGFGRREDDTVGAKYEGKATARALSGEWYPLLFDNDYAAFDAWYWTDARLAEPSADEEAAWWAPGTYTLEAGYELLAGGLPNEAVSCYGDSGGPLLLGKEAKKMTTYGVSFAGEATYSTVCGLGGGYAVLNEEMLAWVQAAVLAAP